MSGAEVVQSWFTPFHYIVYLSAIFIAMVIYYQIRWSKTCRENILVLMSYQDGSSEYLLYPKSGGQVTITNKRTNTQRVFPIDELSTIEVDYPSKGFVPTFLQKKIRMAIVMEDDWEPLLNRHPHIDNVMSPNVAEVLKDMSEDEAISTEYRAVLASFVENVRTAPTRKMIASPAVLGNLINEKITEALIAVNKEIIEPINNIIKQLNKVANPFIIYIGLGIILVVVAFMAYQIIPKMQELQEGMELIQKSLGVQ